MAYQSRLDMLAQSLPIIPPAPKVHAKDLPGWRLVLEFSRNTVSTLPNYAFDVLISRRRILGFDSVLLNDPDGVRHALTTAREKYKRLVSTHRVLGGARRSGVNIGRRVTPLGGDRQAGRC
jgi:hypothetical protein